MAEFSIPVFSLRLPHSRWAGGVLRRPSPFCRGMAPLPREKGDPDARPMQLQRQTCAGNRARNDKSDRAANMTGRPPYDPPDIWQQAEAEGPPPLPRRPRRPPGKRPAQRPRRRIAVAGYGGLGLVCISLAAVAFLFVASPIDAVRDRLIERVNARIGGTVAVSGPASLVLFPRAAVSFKDVAVLAPEGGKSAPIATVPSLEIEVSLWSLLLRQPQVGRLTLHRPAIELSVDAQGRRNWEIAAKRTPAPATADAAGARKPPAPAGPDAAARPPSAAQRIAGGSVRILDATLRYRDERSGEQLRDQRAQPRSGRRRSRRPRCGRGRPDLAREQLRVSGSASPLRTILSGQPVELVLKVAGAPIEAAYAGTLTLKGGVYASNGRISLKAASARALADWLGIAWTAGSAADALAVSVQMRVGGRPGDALLARGVARRCHGGRLAGARPQGAAQAQRQTAALRAGPRQSAGTARPAAGCAPPRRSRCAAGPARPERAKGWSEEPIDLPAASARRCRPGAVGWAARLQGREDRSRHAFPESSRPASPRRRSRPSTLYGGGAGGT